MHPKSRSQIRVVPELGRYVCPDVDEGQALASDPRVHEPRTIAEHPPISSQFNLVFLTAAIGTLIFVVLCLTLTLLAGKEPPPLFEKVIMAFFDLAKIGFGTVVGLLGGKQLQAEADVALLTSSERSERSGT